jgi:hypothetical protein
MSGEVAARPTPQPASAPEERKEEMRAVKMLTTCAAATLLAVTPTLGHAADGEGSGDRLTGLGEYFLVGGGVSDFTDRALRDRLDTGGSWDARVGIGSRFYLGAEAAYVGSYRSFKGFDSSLAMNGAEGIVRLQVPFASGPWLVEPFAFGGIGWNHLSLRKAPAGVKDSADIGVVPFGGGVTLGYGRWLVDARFTYRSTFNDDVGLAPGTTTSDLSHWTVGASVGVEF